MATGLAAIMPNIDRDRGTSCGWVCVRACVRGRLCVRFVAAQWAQAVCTLDPKPSLKVRACTRVVGLRGGGGMSRRHRGQGTALTQVAHLWKKKGTLSAVPCPLCLLLIPPPPRSPTTRAHTAPAFQAVLVPIHMELVHPPGLCPGGMAVGLCHPGPVGAGGTSQGVWKGGNGASGQQFPHP